MDCSLPGSSIHGIFQATLSISWLDCFQAHNNLEAANKNQEFEQVAWYQYLTGKKDKLPKKSQKNPKDQGSQELFSIGADDPMSWYNPI